MPTHNHVNLGYELNVPTEIGICWCGVTKSVNGIYQSGAAVSKKWSYLILLSGVLRRGVVFKVR